MKGLASVFCCLLLAALAFGAGGAGIPDGTPRAGNTGSLDQQWGPDPYGYRAKDSFEATGPTFQWIDISTIGEEVLGLEDDDIKGVFPLGWNFHYYWYDVNQFWVGSNGYIKFSGTGMWASPFASFPNTASPNDVVGPWVADWFFDGDDVSSTCYWWSNGADTAIVSWVNVLAWGQTGNVGNHNFQLILSGTDSSITFQYAVSTSNDVYNNDIEAGIENVTGAVGLSVRSGTYPPNNYAVKFEYPDNSTYVAHDLSVAGVQNETSEGLFMVLGDSIDSWIQIRNSGNQVEPSDTTIFTVRQVTGTVLATDSSFGGSIAPGESRIYTSDNLYAPTAVGVYRLQGNVIRSVDIVNFNNQLRTELHVITIPGELFYDDNADERDWGWAGGNGGMANEFVPPVYPATITQIRIYVVNTLPDGFDAEVYDDDGPDGSPGTLLYTSHVAAPASNAWATVDVPAGEVIITEGAFYVAWMQEVEGITFGIDTTSAPGISRRAWEYTGGWAESRMVQEADPMIRVSIDSPNGPPGEFSRVAPQDNDTLSDPEVQFIWTRSVDPDGDPITYTLRVWSDYPMWGDSSFTTTDTTLTIFIPVPLSPLDEFFPFNWTVRATDGFETVPASNGQGTFIMDIVESADGVDPGLVREYALWAYPNPFNPTSEIRYDLPVSGKVELKIFNLMGEEVATLVDAPHAPGRYSAAWNATTYPSGTYFAVLRASGTTRVHKLLLLK